MRRGGWLRFFFFFFFFFFGWVFLTIGSPGRTPPSAWLALCTGVVDCCSPVEGVTPPVEAAAGAASAHARAAVAMSTQDLRPTPTHSTVAAGRARAGRKVAAQAPS